MSRGWVSRGWAKASACRLQITLSCAVFCHIVSLQYLSRSSLHTLAGLLCHLFLSYGLQVVTREVHRLCLRRLICPAQDHFIFLTVLIKTLKILDHKTNTLEYLLVTIIETVESDDIVINRRLVLLICRRKYFPCGNLDLR